MSHSAHPLVENSVTELRVLIASARRSERLVGLVPTMGALHEGHLSLVRAAKKDGAFVVVTIFVNPTQFGPNEDFHRYPRPLDKDLQLLSGEGVGLVFVPGVEEVYSPKHATEVRVSGVTDRWEGAIRPGHFNGVATVVLKLFNMVQADVAYFGQKDWQQCAVIQRMVADLNVPVRLRICPTVREADGLALSSRNAYLSAKDRIAASVLSRALQTARQLFANGERDSIIVHNAMSSVIAGETSASVDYIALVDPRTLEPLERLVEPTAALVAARFGATRLLDNCLLGLDDSDLEFAFAPVE